VELSGTTAICVVLLLLGAGRKHAHDFPIKNRKSKIKNVMFVLSFPPLRLTDAKIIAHLFRMSIHPRRADKRLWPHS
jgi:hypothetical protein